MPRPRRAVDRRQREDDDDAGSNTLIDQEAAFVELLNQHPAYADEIRGAREQYRDRLAIAQYSAGTNGHGAAGTNGDTLPVEQPEVRTVSNNGHVVDYRTEDAEREEPDGKGVGDYRVQQRAELVQLLDQYSTHTGSAGPTPGMLRQYGSDLEAAYYIDDETTPYWVEELPKGTVRNLIRWLRAQLQRPYDREADVAAAGRTQRRGRRVAMEAELEA